MKLKALILIVLFLGVFIMGCESEEKTSDVTDNELTETEDQVIEPDEKNTQEDYSDIYAKLFDVKSGIIEYKYSGSEEGIGFMYFDDYGSKSAMHKDTVSWGEPNKTHSISLENLIYVYRPDKDEDGVKMSNPMIDKLLQTDEQDYNKVIEEMYLDMGFEKAGKENFMGKECILYQGDMGKILIWEGLLMLMDMEVQGVVTRQEVTSIKTDIPVDSKYFELPTNIKFSEMPAF